MLLRLHPECHGSQLAQPMRDLSVQAMMACQTARVLYTCDAAPQADESTPDM
jgi:hypothetical protein